MSKANFGFSSADQKKIKDDVKTELKQHKAELKQKERDQKAEEKQKEKDQKSGKKGPNGSSSSPLVPTRANAGPSFFGLHWNKGGCGDNAITFVQRCITWIEEPGKGRINETGIYRLSGSHSSVQRLKQLFGSDPSSPLAEHEEVHDVTGVLKLYFREMPEPIIPYNMYDAFITAAQIQDETRAQTLQQLITLLPYENRIIFTLLFVHLNNVSSVANSMDAKNLAIVFAPNVFRPQEDNPELVLADAPFATQLVIELISNPAQYIPDLANKQGSSAPATPSSRPPIAQKSEVDEQLEGFDPFVVANYITYYQSQGYDAENAKKWALYYLQQQGSQPQQQAAPQPQQVAQVQQTPSNHSPQSSGGSVVSPRPAPQQQGFSYSRPIPATPTQNNPSSTSNQPSGSGASGQGQPQGAAHYTPPNYSAAQGPAPNAYASPNPHPQSPQLPRQLPTAPESNYPPRQPASGSGNLTPPTAGPPSPSKRSSGVLNAGSGNQTRQLPVPGQGADKTSPKVSPRGSTVEDSLPPRGAAPTSSERLNGPAVIPPPRPRLLPSPTVGPSGAHPPQEHNNATSPRPLQHTESSSRPPRPQVPPPNAPNFANSILERQRIRGQSISQMKRKVSAQSDDEYKQKMMEMMNEYRSGNANVFQDIK